MATESEKEWTDEDLALVPRPVCPAPSAPPLQILSAEAMFLTITRKNVHINW